LRNHRRAQTNELISIVRNNGKKAVNARDLHKRPEVTTRFNDWITRRIEEYGFSEGEDFYSILSKSTGGRPAAEYILTLDTAKELAMLENNEKGREIRRYLIRIEEAWNSPEAVSNRLSELRLNAEHIRQQIAGTPIGEKAVVHNTVLYNILTKLQYGGMPEVAQSLHISIDGINIMLNAVLSAHRCTAVLP
jgi:phage anti-repressor protein